MNCDRCDCPIKPARLSCSYNMKIKPTKDQMENMGFIQTSAPTLGDKLSVEEQVKVVHLRPFSSRLRLFVRGLGRRVWRGGDGQ